MHSLVLVVFAGLLMSCRSTAGNGHPVQQPGATEDAAPSVDGQQPKKYKSAYEAAYAQFSSGANWRRE